MKKILLLLVLVSFFHQAYSAVIVRLYVVSLDSTVPYGEEMTLEYVRENAQTYVEVLRKWDSYKFIEAHRSLSGSNKVKNENLINVRIVIDFYDADTKTVINTIGVHEAGLVSTNMANSGLFEYFKMNEELYLLLFDYCPRAMHVELLDPR